MWNGAVEDQLGKHFTSFDFHVPNDCSYLQKPSLLRHPRKFTSRIRSMYPKETLSESPTIKTMMTHPPGLPITMHIYAQLSYIHVHSHTHSLTQTAAIPIPVPTHILVTPIFFPVRPSSLKSVATCLAPVHPNGCPKAIAPPFGLT